MVRDCIFWPESYGCTFPPEGEETLRTGVIGTLGYWDAMSLRLQLEIGDEKEKETYSERERDIKVYLRPLESRNT